MAWTDASYITGSWIGDGAPTDSEQIGLWIAKAERLIRREVPDLQARLDVEAELVPQSSELLDTARDVVAAMVVRVFRNPEGRRSTQTATGPYSESVTFGGEQPGGLYLTGEELSALRGVSQGSRAFTIDMIPSDSPYSQHSTRDPWGL
jgi:hypothetical protein